MNPENKAKKEFENFICLGIVKNAQGEVLMIKRKKEEEGKTGEKLTWAFPGGKIFEGETREECVIREVLDETGYRIKPVKLINLKVHPLFPVLVTYFLCELENEENGGKTRQPWEVEEVRWVKPEEIKKLITTPLDEKVALELGVT